MNALPAPPAYFPLIPPFTLAGMPAPPVLNEVADLRLQALSFFVAVFLASAWVVQLIWNALRKDFPAMPPLGYLRALGLTGLWGLLFVLVLAMISGARELMTPGAWERNGITYRVNKGGSAPQPDPRVARLEELRRSLWGYAATHDGRFPPHDFVDDIPEALWHPPDPSGGRYVYAPGLRANKGAWPVAFEPPIYGDRRMVLLTDGTVSEMDMTEVRRLLAESAKPESAGGATPTPTPGKETGKEGGR